MLCAAFLVSQAHAERQLPAHRISADLANQAVAAVVAKCASQGYAETGVLVDADGVQQAVLRGDRVGAHTLDSAFASIAPKGSRVAIPVSPWTRSAINEGGAGAASNPAPRVRLKRFLTARIGLDLLWQNGRATGSNTTDCLIDR